MIDLEVALSQIDELLEGRRLTVETIPVAMALGRTTATAVIACLDQPPFNRCAMDGYAVLADDRQDHYRVIETVAAGHTATQCLKPGTAIRIMTGAPAPPEAGRVIMLEDTDGGDEYVCVKHHSARTNICPQGEDVRTGDTLFPAGTRINSLAMATCCGCGVTALAVFQPLRAAIVSTGNEVVSAVGELGPGKIMNSNSPMLLGLCREWGINASAEGTIRDDLDALKSSIASAAESAELILLSGGVSAGDFDYVPQALRELGFAIHFDRVAVKPGKPLTFASLGETLVLALPGNPVSACVGFLLAGVRILLRLQGATGEICLPCFPLATDYQGTAIKRTLLHPARISQQGEVELIPHHGSGDLAAIATADGFIEIPAGASELPAGSRLRFHSTCFTKLLSVVKTPSAS